MGSVIMAITITKLKMWKNPGYTKGCVEVPPAGSKKLPAPDYTSTTNLRPRKNSTLSAIELPLSFCQVFEMSYLYMEASDGRTPANSIKVFGWIDSVEQTASGEEAVLIKWDVDWWRTYSGSVTWGAGTVTKCTDSTYKRPYRTQPRYWTSSVSDMIPLSDRVSECMVYVIVVITSGGVSSIKYYNFPALQTTAQGFKVIGDGYGTQYYTMSLADCYNGYLDEFFTDYCNNLTDTTFEIIGCYASALYDGRWLPDVPDWYSMVTPITATVNGNTRAMIRVNSIDGYYSKTFSPSIMTDDMTAYDVIDYQGNRIGTLPYGIEITSVRVSLDIGVNGGYEKVMFDSPAFTYATGTGELIQHRAKKNLGLEFSIPCITIPVTENQWSAYLTGGQRDYDITSARISNDQKAVSGLESTFSAGIGGGVTGASAGPLGAIGGFLGGLIGQGAITGIEYGLGQNFNDQLQDARDRLYANQQNGIMLSGGSMKWVSDNNGGNKPIGAYLMKLSADSVSAGEYSQDVTLNGYDVNIPVSSASSYISSGGALRIANLNITGSIPPNAKTYIKSKLEAGVRIVENNPSGVVP